jgi:hypothetical protein
MIGARWFGGDYAQLLHPERNRYRRQTRVPDKAWRWILSITPERLPYNPRFCEEYTLFLPGKPPHRFRSEGCTF